MDFVSLVFRVLSSGCWSKFALFLLHLVGPIHFP